MATRNNFSENYLQFWHKLSKRFSSPVLGSCISMNSLRRQSSGSDELWGSETSKLPSKCGFSRAGSVTARGKYEDTDTAILLEAVQAFHCEQRSPYTAH
jgi:hypothetical protein